jgi:F-type H+-transporting ATPase subunit gamma
MANLKEIRSRIKSVKNIQKVTKAMKMVAAAKLRKSQDNMELARPYEKRLKNLISNLVCDVDNNSFKLLTKKEKVNTVGYIIVTADRGLAASFNTNIIKKAEQEVIAFGKENTILFCIGKKGYEYFQKNGYKVSSYYIDFWNNLNFDIATNIGKNITSSFLQNEVDEIKVIFNSFKNVTTQEIIFETLLPIEKIDNQESKMSDNMIYEPSKDDLLNLLIPKHLNTQIWKYLLESFASEQGARMIAMENATENAGEMVTDLTLEFNKARQTAITTEMLEIVSGAEALSN